MKARYWLAAVTFFALAQTAVETETASQTAKPPAFNYDTYSAKGAGTVDCGKMTSELRDNRVNWDGYYKNYALGFITGTNFHAVFTSRGNPQVGKDTSPEALLAAVELYCGQNPLKAVSDALSSVYFQLALKP